LPQETEQARALNFNKGCYVGQEIVERIRSRGAVHRKFTGFVWIDGDRAVRSGHQDCRSARRKSEKITSAASLHLAGAEKTVALGYIRREVGVPGREVTIGSAKATVVQLPVTDGTLLHEAGSIKSGLSKSANLEHHPA
jgi:folate-binding Fe-S cluster repair protein YgfZ